MDKVLVSVVPILIRILPFVVGGAGALLIVLVFRRFCKIDRTLAGDERLIMTAIEEVQNDGPKTTYLRVTVLEKLIELTETYRFCEQLRVILGTIYLVAGFISLIITGTELSIPGVLDTVKLSFAVNIIGEISAGLLLFGGYETKSAASKQLASLLRLEVSQFIGQSSEYFNQPPEERWRLFTHTAEGLLLNSIAPPPPEKDGKYKDEKEAIEAPKP